ncbi:MAG: helix-turn-helix domain-containing protein [Gemmatimonadaceae bacterium]|nr:helix-turn-helix domain-containing protein [Gemmatimonadaceae bacterium]
MAANAALSTRLLDVVAVAEQLSCSTDAVRRMIRRGELSAIQVGRLVRVHPDSLARLISGGARR